MELSTDCKYDTTLNVYKKTGPVKIKMKAIQNMNKIFLFSITSKIFKYHTVHLSQYYKIHKKIKS